MEEADHAAVQAVRAFAQTDLAQVIKQVKNEIKNTMAEKYVPVLLAFDVIGKVDDQFVLQMENGERIVLRDRAEDGDDHRSVYKLDWLVDGENDESGGQVLFGLMYYDRQDSSLCLHPYSLVTTEHVIRLQY